LADQGTGSWSWTYFGLDYLAQMKDIRPVVASMSLGGSGNQQAMTDSVTEAVDAGVIVVVAGGNNNKDSCNYSPAFVPAAITVGSTTSQLRRSSFSNYGPCTNLWAPGSSIVSASHLSDTRKATLSGTSMACPHVSGAAALLLEENPTLKGPEVLAKLLAKAQPNAVKGLYEGDTNAFLFVGEFRKTKGAADRSRFSPLALAAVVTAVQAWL